jgi:hypothetical protein
MPKGDGKGPPRTPEGRGARMDGTRQGAGPGGNCICPQCGEKVAHKRGTPCYEVECLKCNTRMVRD